MQSRAALLASLVVTLALGSIPRTARAVEMSSASYRILGSNLNGGGHPALVSTAPVPTIGSVGTSIGQSEALGFSGSALTLRTVAPGFWPIVGGGFPSLDADADAIQSFRDNCPWAFNPTQADSGGIDDVAADGIGDACQCGDVDDDGIVDDLDVIAYRGFLAAPSLAPLSPAGVAKCSVIDSSGPCEVLDVTVTRRVLVPLLPDVEQVCAAAQP
jgi:hypothetical protein